MNTRTALAGHQITEGIPLYCGHSLHWLDEATPSIRALCCAAVGAPATFEVREVSQNSAERAVIAAGRALGSREWSQAGRTDRFYIVVPVDEFGEWDWLPLVHVINRIATAV